MRVIHVSNEFPLNRQMRKAVRRGKLQVVRMRGELSPMGGGIPHEMRRPFRTSGSAAVCMANNGAQVGGGAGGSHEEIKLQGLLQQFRACMEEAHKSLAAADAEDILEDDDNSTVQERLNLLPDDVQKTVNEKAGQAFFLDVKISNILRIGRPIRSLSPDLVYYRENQHKACLLVLPIISDLPLPSSHSMSDAPSFQMNYTVEGLISEGLIALGMVSEKIREEEAWYEKDDLLASPHFEPDSWVENMQSPEFGCFIVSNADAIPEEVKKRMREIQGCFFFGHWIAVIALARCLLEYTIADCCGETPEYKKKVRKGKSPPMSCLIQIVQEYAPSVNAKDMTEIREFGNQIMHPQELNTKGIEDSAKDCFRRIVKVVHALYKDRAENSCNKTEAE